jgi:hypothetical protein
MCASTCMTGYPPSFRGWDPLQRRYKMNNQPTVAQNLRTIGNKTVELSVGVPALGLELTADTMGVALSMVRGITPTMKCLIECTNDFIVASVNHTMTEEELHAYVKARKLVTYQQQLDSLKAASASAGKATGNFLSTAFTDPKDPKES